jgi:hypothetical protein
MSPDSRKRRPPIEVARDLLAVRYPEALLAFVAGSLSRGEGTAFSDIDVVLVFEKLEQAWRESFTFQDWPVEVFAHDLQTLRYFFLKGLTQKSAFHRFRRWYWKAPLFRASICSRMK